MMLILALFYRMVKSEENVVNMPDSCLMIYMNIANCVNCNLALSKAIKSKGYRDKYSFCYLLEETFQGKGSILLSEYLNISIDENDMIYSDSLVHLIEEKTDFKSAIIFSKENYTVIFELTKSEDLNLFGEGNFNDILDKKPIPNSNTFSSLLHLHIIDNDTFIIDQNLSKIIKNGYSMPPSNLYTWNIPGLMKEFRASIDSSDIVFKIEFDNLLKMGESYLLFCSGNKFVQKENEIGVYPKTIILQYRKLNNLMEFTKSYILDDPKGCYYDDYSILSDLEKYFILAECGDNNLQPKRCEIELIADSVVIHKPKTIQLSKEMRESAGYYCDYGKNFMYFIDDDKIYTLEGQQLVESLDFSGMLADKEYISGFSNTLENDPAVFISSGTDPRLIKGIDSKGNRISASSRYVVIFSPGYIGVSNSNYFYHSNPDEFIFVNSKDEIVGIRIL